VLEVFRAPEGEVYLEAATKSAEDDVRVSSWEDLGTFAVDAFLPGR